MFGYRKMHGIGPLLGNRGRFGKEQFRADFRREDYQGTERGFDRRYAGRHSRSDEGREGSHESRFEGRRSRFGGGPWDGPERGFGRGRERMFEAGDMKLVVLKLLAEQPSYGYQLIRTMEERLAGGYSPSAGVIYPTLTMLEEEGLTSAAISDANKKVYSLTPEGHEYLRKHADRVTDLFERLEEAGSGFRRGRSPEIMKAFRDLRGAVIAKVSRSTATEEQIGRIAEAIRAAARVIDEM